MGRPIRATGQAAGADKPPGAWTRKVTVYVPAGYVAGTEAPFIVGADGPDRLLFTVLDNLIAAKKVPAMVAISIQNGGGDAQAASGAWSMTPCPRSTASGWRTSAAAGGGAGACAADA